MEETKTLQAIESEAQIQTNAKGTPYKSINNVCYYLENSETFSNLIKYDDWTKRVYFFDERINDWINFTDKHYLLVQRKLQIEIAGFETITKPLIQDAVELYAKTQTFDRALHYIDGLEWDKKNRLDTFMYDAYGVEDSYIKEEFDVDAGDYHAVVGANFFKQMVARITRPGCHNDHVLVLEGAQGIGKSTSLNAIAGNLGFDDPTHHIESKDFVQGMLGILIIEFGEGIVMNKKDAATLKGFVSKKIDLVRFPFDHIVTENPRRCVFVMTTNEQEYLKDPTGSRRYIPVYCGDCDLQYIKDNRDQLFAEAKYRLNSGESYNKYPKDVLEAVHGGKAIKSSYHDAIGDWLENPTLGEHADSGMDPIFDLNKGLTAMDVWVYCLNGQKSQIHPGKTMEITNTLHRLGWEKKRKMVDGTRKNRWYPVDENILKKEEKLENISF